MRPTGDKNPYRMPNVRLWITFFWAITAFDSGAAPAQSDAGAFIARIESPQSPAGTELTSQASASLL